MDIAGSNNEESARPELMVRCGLEEFGTYEDRNVTSCPADYGRDRREGQRRRGNTAEHADFMDARPTRRSSHRRIGRDEQLWQNVGYDAQPTDIWKLTSHLSAT